MNALVICTAAVVVLGVAAFEMVRAMHRRRERAKYIKEMDRLFQIIRDMIDASYVYKNNTEKFHAKFTEHIGIESLRSRGVMDPEVLLRTDKDRTVYKNLPVRDAELWILRKIGFSRREVMVVYGFKNLNSVYVKSSRLNRRMDGLHSEKGNSAGVEKS